MEIFYLQSLRSIIKDSGEIIVHFGKRILWEKKKSIMSDNMSLDKANCRSLTSRNYKEI